MARIRLGGNNEYKTIIPIPRQDKMQLHGLSVHTQEAYERRVKISIGPHLQQAMGCVARRNRTDRAV